MSPTTPATPQQDDEMEHSMNTLPEHNEGQGNVVKDARVTVVRATYVGAGGAIGAILAVVAGTIGWPSIGPAAATAITAIGAIFGAAAGVAALAVRDGK